MDSKWQKVLSLCAVLCCMASIRGKIIQTPSWFSALMAERNCTFTRALYADEQCDLMMYFSGTYPDYMQVVGLGIDQTLEPDVTEFAEAVCSCGALEVTGSCPEQLVKVLQMIISECGEDNLRCLPTMGLTREQWDNRELPKTYKVVKISVSKEDAKGVAAVLQRSMDKLERNKTESESLVTTTEASTDYIAAGDFF